MKNVQIFHIMVILGVWNCSPLFPLKLKFEMYFLQGVWKGRDHFHLESLCLLLAKTAGVARRTTEGGVSSSQSQINELGFHL